MVSMVFHSISFIMQVKKDFLITSCPSVDSLVCNAKKNSYSPPLQHDSHFLLLTHSESMVRNDYFFVSSIIVTLPCGNSAWNVVFSDTPGI